MTLALLRLAGLLWLVGAGPAGGQEDSVRLLIRNLSVAPSAIVFSYAGDLWRVAPAGGTAERLTSGPEEDDYPALSPDGRRVAFSRRGRDGWDVYVIPTRGGTPVRLTYHPAPDLARGWRADSVLFASGRDEPGIYRLYVVSRKGGFPAALPLPRAWDGDFGPDGRLAYVPAPRPGEPAGYAWPGYRGGRMSRIAIVDLAGTEGAFLGPAEANDASPMWIGDRLFFLSDRSGAFNLYSYSPATHEVVRHTAYETYGIDAASSDGRVVAFLRDGRIHVFTPSSQKLDTLTIMLEPDRSEAAPRRVSGARWIQSVAPSPSGDRLVLGMRGDVVRFDPTSGTAENLTRTSGVAERSPVISPDGKWIAYFSDEKGEYALHVRPTEGRGSVRKIPVELKPSYYHELTWSPDSKRLAFSDKKLTLWVVDVETQGARRITTSTFPLQERYEPAWSPDGTWLAYSRYEANGVRAIYVYHAVRGRKSRVTRGRVDAEYPAFDAGGRYLYFVASNTAALGETQSHELSSALLQPLVVRRLQAVVLRQGLPPPVLPLIGEPYPGADTIAASPPRRAERGRARRSPGGGRPRGRPGAGPLRIGLEGLEDRIVPLPAPPRDYVGVVAGAPGELFLLANEWSGSPALGGTVSRTLYRYRLSRPRELEKLVEGVDTFTLTADGARLLYRRGGDWWLAPVSEPTGPDAVRLDLEAASIEVDPAAEWRQMYGEAWRLVGDYFYDPNHHGQDLSKLEDHYAAFLPGLARRLDLNLLLQRGLSHLSVSGLRAAGGDVAEPPGERERVGLLGADYEIHEGRYRITRIYVSGPYSAGAPRLRAPLDAPGVHVQEGDYLIAVDDEPVTARSNLYAAFAGKALTPTRITVAAKPDGEDSRTYTVVPLPSENALRGWNWAERNRQVVREESQGILGYVYVPDFSDASYALILQQLLASSGTRGLIIDARHAAGDVAPDQVIEALRRQPLYYYAFRHGRDLPVPRVTLPAAKVLLVSDATEAAAETFALMFRAARLGTIIGTKTAGVGTGPRETVPRLIDGGTITVPNRAAFNPAGTWDIENDGIEPDTEVRATLNDWWEGTDPQLGAAIRTVLKMIVERPPLEVKRPEYPVHR